MVCSGELDVTGQFELIAGRLVIVDDGCARERYDDGIRDDSSVLLKSVVLGVRPTRATTPQDQEVSCGDAEDCTEDDDDNTDGFCDVVA